MTDLVAKWAIVILTLSGIGTCTVIGGMQQPPYVADADHPGKLKSFSEYDKKQIDNALTRLDLRAAKAHYVKVVKPGVDTGIYPSYLENRLLQIVKPIPASNYLLNHAGYDFLALLYPDNQIYITKRDSYYKNLVSQQNAQIAKLKTKTNELDKIIWYQHPNQPSVNSRSTVYLYIGAKENSRPWLRMQVQYTARKWLFVNSVKAWYDDMELNLVSGAFERDNSSDIWEWADVVPNEFQTELLHEIANAKKTVLRFQGQQYRKDIPMRSSDKRAILDVLAAYDAMLDQYELARTK